MTDGRTSRDTRSQGIVLEQRQERERRLCEDALEMDSSDDDSAPSAPPRGPNRGTHGPSNLAARPFLIYDDGCLISNPSRNVAGIVSSITKSYFVGPWETARSVPPEAMEMMWEAFKGRFQWNFDDEYTIHNTWMKMLPVSISTTLSNARKKAETLASSTYPPDWKGKGPKWMSKDVWNELIDKYFNTEKFYRRSQIGKRNRMTIKDGSISKHACGSISRKEHARRMEQALGYKPKYIDVFKHTQKTRKGNGDFVSQRSKNVNEAYTHAMIEKYGPDLSKHPVFDAEIWTKTAGQPSKGRVFGFGTRQHASDILGLAFPGRRQKQMMQPQTMNLVHDDLKREAEEAKRAAEAAKKMVEEAMQREEALRQQMEDAMQREEALRQQIKDVKFDLALTRSDVVSAQSELVAAKESIPNLVQASIRELLKRTKSQNSRSASGLQGVSRQ